MQAEQIFKAPITGKFYYAVVKNRELAKEEYKLYLDANPNPPQWAEFDAKRIAIIDEVGESVKEGFKMLPNDEKDAILNSPDPTVMPPEKRELLITRINELTAENQEVVDAYNDVERRRREFMAEEDDFPIKKVKLSDIPELVNGNGFKVYEDLDPMIEED
jgi:hypothetical protein